MKTATQNDLNVPNSHPDEFGSEKDRDAIIWRLREICAEPYRKKHGHPMTLKAGWAWEMVHFIHHALTGRQ